MLCLTSRISPTPPPLHLYLTPSWSPYFRLTRWFSQLCLSVLSPQVFLVHRHRLRWSLPRLARPRCRLSRHARAQCPLSRPARPRCLLLRHTRPRCLLPRHARPRCPLLRHVRPRCLLLHLPAMLSRCRCTDVARCRHRRRLRLRRLQRPRRHLHWSRRRHHFHRLARVSSRRCTTRPSSIGILVILIPW